MVQAGLFVVFWFIFPCCCHCGHSLCCLLTLTRTLPPLLLLFSPHVASFHSSRCHPSLHCAAELLFPTIFTVAAGWLLLLTVAFPVTCRSRHHCLRHWNTALLRMMPLRFCFLPLLLAMDAVTVCCTLLQCHQCWLLTSPPSRIVCWWPALQCWQCCCHIHCHHWLIIAFYFHRQWRQCYRLLRCPAMCWRSLHCCFLPPPHYCVLLWPSQRLIVAISSFSSSLVAAANTACSIVLRCAGAASTAAYCPPPHSASCGGHHRSWSFHRQLRQLLLPLAWLCWDMLALPPLLLLPPPQYCFLPWSSPRLIVALLLPVCSLCFTIQGTRICIVVVPWTLNMI